MSVDIHVTPEEWAASNAAYLTEKIDKRPNLALADLPQFNSKIWARWVQDHLGALQDYAQESSVGKILRLGDRRIRLVAGSPEGSVTAEPGSIAVQDDGQKVWKKATGSGNTGWVEFGAGGAQTVYEVNYAGLGAQNFKSGGDANYVIDGKTWTIAGTASIGTMALDGEDGLDMAPAVSTGASFTSGSQSAGHAYTTLADLLGSDWDPSRRWEFAIEFQDDVWENGNDAIRLGLWGPAGAPHATSATRMRLVDRGNHSGTQTVRILSDGTVSSLGTDYSAVKAIGLTIDNQGVGQILAGTSLSTLDCVGSFTSEDTTLDPFIFGGCRLVLALICSSDSTPLTKVTVTKLRVRAV